MSRLPNLNAVAAATTFFASYMIANAAKCEQAGVLNEERSYYIPCADPPCGLSPNSMGTYLSASQAARIMDDRVRKAALNEASRSRSSKHHLSVNRKTASSTVSKAANGRISKTKTFDTDVGALFGLLPPVMGETDYIASLQLSSWSMASTKASGVLHFVVEGYLDPAAKLPKQTERPDDLSQRAEFEERVSALSPAWFGILKMTLDASRKS